MVFGKADNKSIFILMTKKLFFGVIGFVGFAAIMFAPSANAAVSAPEVDQPTRALLGQTLNVLQTLLDTIQSRINSAENPIQDPAAVKAVLGGIKDILVSVDAELSGFSAGSVLPVATFPEEQPADSLNGVPADKETANAASSLSPKLLFVFLPVLILAAVTLAFFRKRDDAPSEASAIAEEPGEAPGVVQT